VVSGMQRATKLKAQQQRDEAVAAGKHLKQLTKSSVPAIKNLANEVLAEYKTKFPSTNEIRVTA
jgi:hypothetical protein